LQISAILFLFFVFFVVVVVLRNLQAETCTIRAELGETGTCRAFCERFGLQCVARLVSITEDREKDLVCVRSR
jgi:hypothetical protein